MTRLLLLVAACSACQAASSELPWLHGIDDVRLGTLVAPGRAPDDEQLCSQDDAYNRIELVANVTPHAGRERLIASYADGLQLWQGDGTLLALVPGRECVGSRDEVRALASATIHGEPVLVLVLTAGGRNERTTVVELFRARASGRLDRVFAGVVEQVRGDDIATGTIMLLRRRLVYRAPDGRVTTWRFDEPRRTFVLEDILERPGHTL
jgi:hypothetical protein